MSRASHRFVAPLAPFDTSVEGKIMTVSKSAASGEERLMAVDLRWLADRMMNGRLIDDSEKFMAGCALGHLLALSKTIKRAAE